MINLPSNVKLKRQVNFIASKSGDEQSNGLKNIFSSNVQIQELNKFSSGSFGQKQFVNIMSSQNEDLQTISRKYNYISQQTTQAIKKNTILLSTQSTFSSTLAQTKQKQFKKNFLEPVKQIANIQNKVDQAQTEILQNKNRENTKQKDLYQQSFWGQQNFKKIMKISQQAQNKQSYGTNNRKQNQQKKTGIKDQSSKQNYYQTMMYSKRTKSIKKVAFQQAATESHKEDIKSLKHFTETSIKIDEPPSEVSSSHYQMKNSSRSLRMISENGTYRMTKIVGSNQDVLKLMIKQVQLKSPSIQIKQQQLFMLSSENKHPNILRMFSKSKIYRQNKTYLEIKMQFYQNNLINYITINQSSPSLAIQRKIILFQILKALNFIHQKKIYHRDLNPFNIMVGDGLKVAITNFAYIQHQPNHQFSKNNFYQCNSFIRPPEIILNPLKSFDGGGDIWALGCVIVFMLKGDMPFKDYSDAEMIIQMIKFLGKPSTQYLQSIGFKHNRRFIFPDLPKLSMKRFFKCEDDCLFEMLESIFRYKSQLRVTSENLLRCKYFDELRDQKTFQNLCRRYEIYNLFDFSNQILDNNKKKLIIPQWYKSS